MRLELLITAIPPDDRGRVADNLQLPQASVERLANFESAATRILAQLPQCDRPSQVVHLLQNDDVETLVLVCVRQPRETSDRIWRYLTHWSQVKAMLNGNDLKKLGYPPGPRYRAMLDELLTATLDGEIRDREGAIALLQQRYPTPSASNSS
jgi:tRNA nucleotidyltransferase (CCA-adding enzyme)